jgi:hypothetical protein
MSDFPLDLIKVDAENDRVILGFVWLDSNPNSDGQLDDLAEISKYIDEDGKILTKYKRQIEEHLSLLDEMENCKYKIQTYSINIEDKYQKINNAICNLYSLDSK